MIRKYVFYFYWLFLIYIIAALTWWFVFILQQNIKIKNFNCHIVVEEFKTHRNQKIIVEQNQKINIQYQLKVKQIIGEYLAFFSLIIFGAWSIYKLLKKEITVQKKEQDFLMTMTHELKTPIAICLLNLETIKKNKTEKMVQQELLNSSLNELKRLNACYDNIMTSIYLDESKKYFIKENVNINKVISKIIDDYKPRFVDFSFQLYNSETASILADEQLIEMCLKNLIDNAIKYSFDQKKIVIKSYILNKWNIVEIIDFGVGIEDHQRKFVFEKFYRIGNELSRKTKGTGLGLYLVKKILKDCGGKIEIANNFPNGSVFKVYFKPI